MTYNENLNKRRNWGLLGGSSALALSLAMSPAIAQEAEQDTDEEEILRPKKS